MITVTPYEKLGAFDTDWLKARYHFSFFQYLDPKRMGWGPLRVWNDDEVAPGTGFDTHPHRDMEIITYVRRGAITHRDNLGNEGRTEAGSVQVMSAGTGIFHSEHNEEAEPTHVFQIWIKPNARGHEPRWANREFPKELREGRLDVLASGRAEDEGTDALPIHQDAAVLGATLKAGEKISHVFGAGRRAYLVPAEGEILVNGLETKPRAGVAISEEREVVIEALTAAEVVLVDVP